jgi:hypothetical protein
MVQYVPTRVMPTQNISKGAIIMSILSFALSLVFAFLALAALFVCFKDVQDGLAVIQMGQIQNILQFQNQLQSAEGFLGIALLCFVVSTLFIPLGLLFMAIQLKKYA